ncbi:VOC family protein [Pontibacillus sp. ALD_SL1]|uniref:VOC family protein n=1 Tax=Pontibacillus sp. ALD_SL1 TaxID=2777185 RepID=UPI001A9729DE|nr:VOC family protein [Pontibacillus sp. ALD_SL1]QST01141.1 VOC family protein [Pontibacillus sp. ALD_SL1]
MNFREFGLILFTEKYEECISFYKDLLQLPVRNVKSTLVSFDLPHGYLMVEQGGVGSDVEKARNQNPTVVRFDVEDLDEEVQRLEERGGSFKERRLEFEWGTIAVLSDPDGNRIEIGELNDSSASVRS